MIYSSPEAGLAVALPPGWARVDMASLGRLDAGSAGASAESLRYSVQQTSDAGGHFFAFDSRSVSSAYATRAFALRQQAPATALSVYLDEQDRQALRSGASQVLYRRVLRGNVGDVVHRRVRITPSGTNNSIDALQFFVLGSRFLDVLVIEVVSDSAERDLSTLESMGASFTPL
jgi:hypothetical protein